MQTDMLITERGEVLWARISCAFHYAHARVVETHTRQRVVPVPLHGQTWWRVKVARCGRREVAEPCS